MQIEAIRVGSLETNALVVYDSECAVIVDPGDEPNRFIHFLNQRHLSLKAILLTHGHGDHIGAVKELRNHFADAEVVCHPDDAPMLTDPMKNLTALMGQSITAGKADKLVNDGDTLTYGSMSFKVMHVPGHTPGHIVFLIENHLLAGDTLFAGGVGRWDLPGGNGRVLFEAIQEKLMTLPDNVKVWPGHGATTTIGFERQNNPYLEPGFNPDMIGL